MRQILVAIIMLLVTSTANASVLDVVLSAKHTVTDDVLMEACYQVLHAADWYTTSKILKGGGYEVNPMIGKHPSSQKLHTYFAASALAHATVIYMSPKKWRPLLQRGSVGIKWSLVDHNYNVDHNMREGWSMWVTWQY